MNWPGCIYGFAGRLLAEYNGLGICVRDYIYMGGKLIAEYRPQENATFYYATDQIGSTRIVTDDSGAVVYAAAHDPYGGIQKTWTSAYDPALKFSGKERDTESGLDYFGARYYDRTQYRFISVDPKLVLQVAQADPQRWNLYSYCSNNPVNVIDPNGKWGELVHYHWTRKIGIMFAGMSPDLATTIAEANNYVDNIRSSETTSITRDEQQRKDWHFISTERYIEAITICETTLDPKEFGKYLHVIQDYFAHSSVSLLGGSSHLHPRYAGIDDPYSGYHSWDKVMEMAQLTLDLMRRFQERRAEAVAAAAAAVALSLIFFFVR